MWDETPASGPVGYYWRNVILAGLLRQIGNLKNDFLTKSILFFPLVFIPLLVFFSASVSPTSALGQSSGDLGDLQNRSEEIRSSYEQALADLVAANSEVSRYEAEIAHVNGRQADVQSAIASEQANLSDLQSQLDERQQILEKRVTIAYKSDDINVLDVIMDAGDFDDLLTRLDLLGEIADSDRQMIDSYRESKDSVEQKLASLEASQAELDGLYQELSSAQENMVAAQSEKQGMVDSLQSEQQMTEGQITQLQSEASSVGTRMDQLQDEAYSGGGYTPPPAGGSSFSVTATSYCLGGTTATGMPVGRGIIAVDPRVIPLGSQVYVSGYGNAIAADTGGAIRGNKIDVWLPCGEAIAWGVRTVSVTVY